MNSLEMCAGAGGQALGLERSGFGHEALVELDSHACNTLRLNRPRWNVIEGNEQHSFLRAIRFIKEIRSRRVIIENGRRIWGAVLENRLGYVIDYA